MKFIIKYRLFWFLVLLLGNMFQAKSQDLEEYLKIAAENNPGVKAAYAEFKAAMQEVPQVSSLPDPTLTMSAFGGMATEEARFSLMQMFPWFGTLEAKGNAAALAAEAKFQFYLEERNRLFYEVSSQYFDLYSVERSIEFQQDNLKIIRDYKELALAKVRAGSGALADVLQTDLLINETRTALEILEMRREPLEAQFNALLNRKPDAAIKIPRVLSRKVNNLALDEDVDFGEHPRLVAMEKMLAAAKAQEEVARKSSLPSFGLGVEYVVMGEPGMVTPMLDGEDAIMPMLSVTLPIFRKKYKAAKKEARFMQEVYSQRKIQVSNTLSSELEAAVFSVKETLSVLRLYREQIESSSQILNLLLSAYQNAGADFEEVLRVRQELLKYQLALAEAEAAYFSALGRIYYLTGKPI